MRQSFSTCTRLHDHCMLLCLIRIACTSCEEAPGVLEQFYLFQVELWEQAHNRRMSSIGQCTQIHNHPSIPIFLEMKPNHIIIAIMKQLAGITESSSNARAFAILLVSPPNAVLNNLPNSTSICPGTLSMFGRFIHRMLWLEGTLVIISNTSFSDERLRPTCIK